MCPQEVDKKTEEKTPLSNEFYQPIGNVDITLWGRCHYDDEAKLLLAKAEVGDRFAVVGWAVEKDGQMIQEVRIRPTAPPQPQKEEDEEQKAFKIRKKQYKEKIEVLQVRYGDKLVFAQEPSLAQGGSGVVHEAVINDITKSELKSAQVISGLSFTVESDDSGDEKKSLDKKKLVWLNRSTKNQSFKLTSIARLCHMFSTETSKILSNPARYTQEVNLERAIPKKQFDDMLKVSSEILGMKCEYRKEQIHNLRTQEVFAKIMQLEEVNRKKEITRRFNTNLYIASASVPMQMTSTVSSNYQSNGLLDNMTRLILDAKNNNVELDMNFIPENLEGTDSSPALLLAVKKGYTKIVERLCSYNKGIQEKNKFNVLSKNKDGNNILHNACLCEVEDKKDPSVNIQNNLLEQLFKLEGMKDNINVVNAKNKKGETPLHIAMKKANIDVIKTLIYKKADPDIRDPFGWTPRLIALCYDKLFSSLSPTENKEESPNISILKSALVEYGMAEHPQYCDHLILMACEKKDIKVISALINLGFNRDELLYHIANQRDSQSNEDYAKIFKEFQPKDDKEIMTRMLMLAAQRDDDYIIDVLDNIQKIEKDNILGIINKVLQGKGEPETGFFIKKVIKKFSHEMKPADFLPLVKLAAKNEKYYLIKILQEEKKINPVLLFTAAMIAISNNSNQFFKNLISDFGDEMKNIQVYADNAAKVGNYATIEILKENNLTNNIDFSRLAITAIANNQWIFLRNLTFKCSDKVNIQSIGNLAAGAGNYEVIEVLDSIYGIPDMRELVLKGIEKGQLDFCKKILDNFENQIPKEEYGQLKDLLFNAQYKKSKPLLLSGIIASPDSAQSNILESKPTEQKPDSQRKPT